MVLSLLVGIGEELKRFERYDKVWSSLTCSIMSMVNPVVVYSAILCLSRRLRYVNHERNKKEI